MKTRLLEKPNRMEQPGFGLGRIMDNLSIGVALIGPDLAILDMNHQLRTWFETNTNAKRLLCHHLLNGPGHKTVCRSCPILNTVENGAVHEMTREVVCSNQRCDFRVVCSPVYDNQGQVTSVIALYEDITEKKVMERELIQNQKLASIGQLAAGVAHEINNPTGFVSSNLKTLDDYQQDLRQLINQYRRLKDFLLTIPEKERVSGLPEQLEEIETLEMEIDIDYISKDIGALITESREGAERIKKIVDDLKRFAHPGQDKIQDTDINAGLESTLNIVNNELKYKAKITKEFGDLPIVAANPQQLNQVFANILVNAAHAIEQQGEIKIRTADKGDCVEICISDNGCGIAEENLNKIFDPFFTTKEVGKGTGLGMNIVHGIIQKHQGTINVHSRLGEGTTFIIQLPIEQNLLALP